jgi:uncharacterized protein (TIGR02996 family)
MSPQSLDELDDLRWAVLEDPANDAARLVLADWYERNGQESRASALRSAVGNREVQFGPFPDP